MHRLAQLRLDTQDRVAVATVDGEIDLSNATGLEMAISESVPNQALGLVVDVAGVRYPTAPGSASCSTSPAESRGASRSSRSWRLAMPRYARSWR